MDEETLFTASKWTILEQLQDDPQSPKHLAEELGTSVANISQQLRLLEMADLVESERVSNREKGQPRVLYSLAGDHSYLISAANGFVEKQFHELSDRNKAILRIWLSDMNPEDRYLLEKSFWLVEPHIDDITGLYLDTTKRQLELTVVTVSDSLEDELDDLNIEDRNEREATITITTVSVQSFLDEDDTERYYAIYDTRELRQKRHREGNDE